MAQNQTTPKKTINMGLKCLASGDTLTIRAGTYVERINNTIPSGVSDAARTTIQAASGETVMLQPTVAGSIITIATRAYITVRNLILDGTNIPPTGNISGVDIRNQTHHVTLQGLEIRNMLRGTGVGAPTDSHHIIVSGGSIHHLTGEGGRLGFHGFYFKAPNSLIENMTIYEVTGNGMQIFDAQSKPFSNITIRNNVLFNTGMTSKGDGDKGIHLGCSGSNILIYNNVIYNWRGAGIRYCGSNVALYNNTFYNVTQFACIRKAPDAPFTQTEAALVKNNISYQCGGVGNRYTPEGNFTDDPKFVNPAQGNFCLQADSPAKGKGADCTTVGPNNGTGTDQTPDGTSTPSAGTACHTITSPQTVPAGFGVPYSAVTTTHELLITAGCQGNDISVTVGNAESPLLTYAWPTIHYWLGSTRKTTQLTCAEQVSGWCRKEGSATITANQNETWVIGYACQWDGRRWWCGCRTSQCSAQNATGSLWQAQLIVKP
jgi:hypothetical protein